MQDLLVVCVFLVLVLGPCLIAMRSDAPGDDE